MEYKKKNNKFGGKRQVQKTDRPFATKEKYREELDENIIFGRNAVKELLSSGRDIEKIFIQNGDPQGSVNLLLGIAAERKLPIHEVDRAKLDSICQGGNHQGIVAIASERNYATVDEIIEYAESRGEKPFVIILDGVEDPHNLGALIRSAECSGAHGVIIPKRRAVGLTSTAAKASAGAVEHMRVAKVTNLATTIDELKEKGLWLYAADMDGVSFYDTDFSGGVGLVMGSEGFGISRLVKEKCDFVVSIPLYGNVNSLNVSCAGAVIMTEVARQRNRK